MLFHITLENAEDRWIVAECPALPGSVSQGKDEKEAKVVIIFGGVMRVIAITILMLICTMGISFAKEVPYTLEDRERLVRVEVKVEEGLKAVNQRIDGLEKRVDGIHNPLYVLIGAILTQTLGIVGFVGK